MLDIYNLFYDLFCINSSVFNFDMMVAEKSVRDMSSS